MVPVHSPEIILGRYWAFCAYRAVMVDGVDRALVQQQDQAKAMLAACHISWTVAASSHGMPWPPNSGSNGSEFQPPSTNSL